MRTIGEIPHAKYKITVLEMNNKITIQIEDSQVNQSFTFRDGSGVSNLKTATEYIDQAFMQKVEHRFQDMKKDYIKRLEDMSNDMVDDFQII